MSPFLFSADHAATDQGRARARITVADASVLSITDLFADYAKARQSGDDARAVMIRLAVQGDEALLAELDGFDFPAAA
ncbi:hypothetical protein RKD49_002108 [Streptomyces glaucescens]